MDWYKLRRSLGEVNLRNCKGISSNTSVLASSREEFCDVIVYYETSVEKANLQPAEAPALFPMGYTIPVRVGIDLRKEIHDGWRCEILNESGANARVRFWIPLLPGKSKKDFPPDTV